MLILSIRGTTESLSNIWTNYGEKKKNINPYSIRLPTNYFDLPCNMLPRF